MAKPHPKQLITSNLIIIDTEGSSEGLDLTKVKLDLNASHLEQRMFPIQGRKNLLKLKKKSRRY